MVKFEEALAKMREGYKIRHPSMKIDEYLIACRVGLPFGFEKEKFEEMPFSIAKMNGDQEHHTMIGKMGYVAKIKRQLKEILNPEDYKKYHNFYTELEIAKIFDENLFSAPQLNLLSIMCDDWEVVEEPISEG